MARASAAARGIPSAMCRGPIDGTLCEFGLAWFTSKRRAAIDPQRPRQSYPCRHPYPRIIAARHYLGFPGKARSVLPLLPPSEVDTRIRETKIRPPPELCPVWVTGGGAGLEQDRQPYPSKP